MFRRPSPDPAGPGQESVWDYPRPPAIRPDDRLVEVVHSGVTVASTDRALRVLETSHPPGYYLPFDDVRMDLLVEEDHQTYCEWKGRARYWSLHVDGASVRTVAWSYPEPTPGFEALTDHVSFYPGRVDTCLVAGERVRPQAGGFYGGWILDETVGPFKGEPGTMGW